MDFGECAQDRGGRIEAGEVNAVQIVVVDNYDSFTHNLVQALGALGARLTVLRNRDEGLMDKDRLFRDASGVVLSPGPGVPERAGRMPEVLTYLLRRRPDLPVLGVCLGLQAMAESYGSALELVHPVHGEASEVFHDGLGLLEGVPSPFLGGRYHSWAVAPQVGPGLRISARSRDGTIMAVRFADSNWEGLQFHPESILTPQGPRILEAFYRRCIA